MRRLAVAALALGALAASTPPAHAGTSLGGYSASAEAAVIRIGIYEPAVPIPAEPQIDAGIGFARATTANGPSARGVASYLWPGDAVGDGLGVLLGDESLDYPVKTTSSYPATEAGPAKNAVQINQGNGMSTSADGTTTRATVVGLGLGNGVSDPGAGLCTLAKNCSNAPPKVDLPDPVAAAATIENLKSQSTVVLGEKGITATARSVASGISILGGLITLEGLDLRSQSSSDGGTGTAQGTSKITGLKVLGRGIDLGDPVSFDGKPTTPPKLPQVLDRLGITIEYLGNEKATEDASGALSARGLTITVDVAPLRNLLRLGGLSDLLAPGLAGIDQLGPVLTGLLKLGTKVVITVGDVRTSATASPAYVVPPGTEVPPGSAPVASGPLTPGMPPTVPGILPGSPGIPPLLTVGPSSIDLPGLGRVPTWFVLAGLALVALVARGFNGFGAWVLGAGSCVHGKTTGVPDLRKVRSP